jgi:hypothetical protein
MNTDDQSSDSDVISDGMRILLVVTKADVGGAQKRIIDMAAEYTKAGR